MHVISPLVLILFTLVLIPTVESAEIMIASSGASASMHGEDGGGSGRRQSHYQVPPSASSDDPMITAPPDNVTKIQKQTWYELTKVVSQMVRDLLAPYISFFEEYPISLLETFDTIKSAVASSSLTDNPAVTAAVGTAAAALPILIHASRSLLESVVGLLDNCLFVFTGQGLGRHALDTESYDDIADILLKVVSLVARHLGR